MLLVGHNSNGNFHSLEFKSVWNEFSKFDTLRLLWTQLEYDFFHSNHGVSIEISKREEGKDLEKIDITPELRVCGNIFDSPTIQSLQKDDIIWVTGVSSLLQKEIQMIYWIEISYVKLNIVDDEFDKNELKEHQYDNYMSFIECLNEREKTRRSLGINKIKNTKDTIDSFFENPSDEILDIENFKKNYGNLSVYFMRGWNEKTKSFDLIKLSNDTKFDKPVTVLNIYTNYDDALDEFERRKLDKKKSMHRIEKIKISELFKLYNKKDKTRVFRLYRNLEESVDIYNYLEQTVIEEKKNNENSSEILNQLDETHKINKIKKDIKEYMQDNDIFDKYELVTKYNDILMIYNDIVMNQTIDNTLIIENYSAQTLKDEIKDISDIEIIEYLIGLREQPDITLEKIKEKAK